MKKLFLSALLAGFCLSAGAQSNQVTTSKSLVDGYIAKVNDRAITMGEVWELLAPQEAEIQRTSRSEAEYIQRLDVVFKATLNSLIEKELIIQDYKAANGALPERYVTEELKRIINSSFGGNEALFEQMLTEKRMTKAEYIQSVREKIIVGMMTSDRVTRRARVTPKQIRDAYDENIDQFAIPEGIKFKAIILNKGTTPDEQQVKMQEAEGIYSRLKDGADFAQLARESSEGLYAAQGGDFPWVELGSLSDTMQEKLKTVPVGEISNIVAEENALYIVKVEGRKEAGYLTFEEARDRIKEVLLMEEQQRLHDQWIAQLKKSNYVKMYKLVE
ncbi:MAG: peptidyl-prolyl cis-trans isomerase [Pontiellaceae bacterium]|nr:peptidyl-prolyl cis-trans isomerase [Pontiellaceae bacterium]